MKKKMMTYFCGCMVMTMVTGCAFLQKKDNQEPVSVEEIVEEQESTEEISTEEETTEEAEETPIVLFDEDNVLVTVKDVTYQETDQFELVMNLEITNQTPNKLTIQTRDGELIDTEGNALESGDIIFSATVQAGETVESELKLANNTNLSENPQEMEEARFRMYVEAYLNDKDLSDYIHITGIQEEEMSLTVEEGTGEKQGDINIVR